MTSLLPTTPEAASRGAELVTSDGRALALVSAHLRGEAQGGLARPVLEQRFENPFAETLKVTYRMPLPAVARARRAARAHRHHPAWHDLDAAARERAFELARALRPLEAALDADGLSTTARAVLQKTVSARTE